MVKEGIDQDRSPIATYEKSGIADRGDIKRHRPYTTYPSILFHTLLGLIISGSTGYLPLKQAQQ